MPESYRNVPFRLPPVSLAAAEALRDSTLFQTLTQSAYQTAVSPLLQSLMSREHDRHQPEPPSRVARERGNLLQPAAQRFSPRPATALNLLVVPCARREFLVLDVEPAGGQPQRLLVTPDRWPWVARQFSQYLAEPADDFTTASRQTEIYHYLAHLVAAQCVTETQAANWLAQRDLPPYLPASPASLRTLLPDPDLMDEILAISAGRLSREQRREQAAGTREELVARLRRLPEAHDAANPPSRAPVAAPTGPPPGQPVPAEPRRRILKRPS